MKSRFDWLISHIPWPFFVPAVKLFCPDLWHILEQANVTKQGDKMLVSWHGLGHFIITSFGIRQIGT